MSGLVCSENNIELRFADISQIMAKSRNWDELQYVWTEWRRRSGMRIKDLYQQLVTLNNEAAKLNSTFENYLVMQRFFNLSTNSYHFFLVLHLLIS